VLFSGGDLDFAFESISAFSDNGENQGYIFLLESVENIGSLSHSLQQLTG